MNPEQFIEWQRYMEKQHADLSLRITEVEKGFAIFQAVATKQQEFLQDRINRVQDNIIHTKEGLTKSIDDTKKDLIDEIAPIKSGINKVVWAVALAIVAAVSHWLLKGGLFIVN